MQLCDSIMFNTTVFWAGKEGRTKGKHQWNTKSLQQFQTLENTFSKQWEEMPSRGVHICHRDASPAASQMYSVQLSHASGFNTDVTNVHVNTHFDVA